MAASTFWGPSSGPKGMAWRDTGDQAAVRLMMEVSMTKGRLQEQEEKASAAEERAASAQKERDILAAAHQKTLQHLRAAEEENEILQTLIQKHNETVRRVREREQELDSEANGTKKALETVRCEVGELRREVAQLTREKRDAEHLAGQIADALNMELNKKFDQEAAVAEVEARLKDAVRTKEQLERGKADLQRACNRLIRDLKSARERTEEASVKERSASVKLNKASSKASQMQKALDVQASQNYALLSEKLRLHEELRTLRATLAQRELLIRDLKEGVDYTSGGSPPEEKKLDRESWSTSGSRKKAGPRKASNTPPKLAGRKRSDDHDYVDKRCSDSRSISVEQSCEASFESNKAVLVAAAS